MYHSQCGVMKRCFSANKVTILIGRWLFLLLTTVRKAASVVAILKCLWRVEVNVDSLS